MFVLYVFIVYFYFVIVLFVCIVCLYWVFKSGVKKKLLYRLELFIIDIVGYKKLQS